MLLGNAVAVPTGFDFGPFNSVTLQEPVELFLLPSVPLKVVELNLAGIELADRGVSPAGELESEARSLAAKEPSGPLHRLRQAQPPAGSANCLGIPDLGLDLNDMGQNEPSITKGC